MSVIKTTSHLKNRAWVRGVFGAIQGLWGIDVIYGIELNWREVTLGDQVGNM